MRGLLLVLAACGGGSDDPACDNGTADLPLVADTYVDGTIPHGNDGVLAIGGTSQALLRFRLGELDASTLRYVLTLTSPATANECGAGCGACPTVVVGTGVRVSIVRSDWSETAATAELRDDAMPWSMPGPSGVDIVQLAATSATANGRSLAISFNALGRAFDPAWPDDEVTVLVTPTNAGTPVIQYSSRSNDCEPESAPRLAAQCE